MLSLRIPQIVTAVQSIVSRNIVSTHGSLRDYDRQISRRQRGHVIADKAGIRHVMCTTTPQTRESGHAEAEGDGGGRGTGNGRSPRFVGYRPGYIAQKNDDSVMDVVMETAEECIGKENIFIKEYPSMGVEDFAFYSRERPSAFFFVGTGYRGRKITGYITENLRRMRVLWISPCSWRL